MQPPDAQQNSSSIILNGTSNVGARCWKPRPFIFSQPETPAGARDWLIIVIALTRNTLVFKSLPLANPQLISFIYACGKLLCRFGQVLAAATSNGHCPLIQSGDIVRWRWGFWEIRYNTHCLYFCLARLETRKLEWCM